METLCLKEQFTYIQMDVDTQPWEISLKFQQSSPVTSSLDHIIPNVDCVHAKEKTAFTHDFLSMQKSQKTPLHPTPSTTPVSEMSDFITREGSRPE